MSNFGRKFGQFGSQINRTVGTVIANGKKHLQRSNDLKVAAGEINALNYMDVVKRTCDCPVSNLAHDIIQYENLKNMLKIKEFTSIINVTKHGIQRLIERGFTVSDVKEVIQTPDMVKNQLDSAAAFIKKIDTDKYNIIIYNNNKKRVITAFKNISRNKVVNLGINYGWEL